MEVLGAMPTSLKAPAATPSPTSLRDVLAYNVRAHRVTKLLSQKQLGFAAGLDRTFISQMERAKINVSLDNIEKVANAPEIEASRLLERPKA